MSAERDFIVGSIDRQRTYEGWTDEVATTVVDAANSPGAEVAVVAVNVTEADAPQLR